MNLFKCGFILCLLSCQTKQRFPEGGFEYPKSIAVNDTNLYYYPLKTLESKRNQFIDSYLYLFFQPFEEPNLSTRPQLRETFRRTYSSPVKSTVLIILTPDEITIKRGAPSILYTFDTSKLSEIENLHFTILRRRYPLSEVKETHPGTHYFDSLTTLYPQLKDPAYYHQLYEKILSPSGEKFTYSKTNRRITNEQYNEFIDSLNLSGFWSKHFSIDCESPSMDGHGFTLEANTKYKYKVVSVTGCPGDNTIFTRVCQKLVEMATMENEIRL